MTAPLTSEALDEIERQYEQARAASGYSPMSTWAVRHGRALIASLRAPSAHHSRTDLTTTPESAALAERERKLPWLLLIIDKMGGRADVSDSPGHWIAAFCDDGEPDTFNLAIDRGLLRSAHNSDWDISVASLTDAGRAFLRTPLAAPSRPEGVGREELAAIVREALLESGAFSDQVFSQRLTNRGRLANDTADRILAALQPSPASPPQPSEREAEKAPIGTDWKTRARWFADVAIGNAAEITRLLALLEPFAKAGEAFGTEADSCIKDDESMTEAVAHTSGFVDHLTVGHFRHAVFGRHPSPVTTEGEP